MALGRPLLGEKVGGKGELAGRGSFVLSFSFLLLQVARASRGESPAQGKEFGVLGMAYFLPFPLFLEGGRSSPPMQRGEGGEEIRALRASSFKK